MKIEDLLEVLSECDRLNIYDDKTDEKIIHLTDKNLLQEYKNYTILKKLTITYLGVDCGYSGFDVISINVDFSNIDTTNLQPKKVKLIYNEYPTKVKSYFIKKDNRWIYVCNIPSKEIIVENEDVIDTLETYWQSDGEDCYIDMDSNYFEVEEINNWLEKIKNKKEN